MNFNSFGIIIPMFCVLILVACFIYEKSIEKQYIKDGDCIYKNVEVCPYFILGLFTTIQFDEIKLDNKTIFRQTENSKIVQIQNAFFAGKKRIELFNKNKSIIVDSVCLFDDYKNYWLNIEKDIIGNNYYFQLEPVTLD